MRITDCIVIAATVLGAGSTRAPDAASELPGVYVGGTFGGSSASLNSASAVYPNTLIDPSVGRRKGDLAGQLSGGYRFNRYLAVEASGDLPWKIAVADLSRINTLS